MVCDRTGQPGEPMEGAMNGMQTPAQQSTQPKGSVQTRLPPRKSWLIFLVLLFLNYLVMRYLFPGPG